MRKQFVKTLIELAEEDDRIYLLTGDVGFSYFEEFKKKFPERFINCGIIEQSMMAIAAGLATAGKKPYVYSMIPFVLMRCYEQLRDDVCYGNADVKIIGIGGKQYYKFLGMTHNIYNDEDLVIVKIQPNIKAYTPSTPEEVKEILLKTYKEKTPSYIRL